MFDFVKAGDLGISIDISSDPEFYNSTDILIKYAPAQQDILRKINHFTADLAERDLRLNLTKPLLPHNFKLLPSVVQSHVQSQTSKAVAITKQAPQIQTPQSALKDMIAHAEMLANMAHNLSELQEAINNFQSNLEIQKICNQTLMYHDASQVDILWISDTISLEDDRQKHIASDPAGQMIEILFQNLGFNRSPDNDISKHKIGFTALSFWPLEVTGISPLKRSEYDICLPFLKKLIYFIQPKKIILSGAHIFQYLTGVQYQLGNAKMQPLEILDQKFPCYGVISKEQILSSDAAKKLFWFDLLKILNNN